MSQGPAKRLRKRFSIKFRDVAKIGRPKYPAKTYNAKREAKWLENKRKGLF